MINFFSRSPNRWKSWAAISKAHAWIQHCSNERAKLLYPCYFVLCGLSVNWRTVVYSEGLLGSCLWTSGQLFMNPGELFTNSWVVVVETLGSCLWTFKSLKIVRNVVNTATKQLVKQSCCRYCYSLRCFCWWWWSQLWRWCWWWWQ